MNQVNLENKIFSLTLNNKFIFIKKIKNLLFAMNKNIGIFDPLFTTYESKIDKKEIMLLIFYSKLISNYKNEKLNLTLSIKNKNYNHNLLITNKLPNAGGIIYELIHHFTNLMCNNQGSGFFWNWDYFSYINRMKNMGTKIKYRLIKSNYLKHKKENIFSISNILNNKNIVYFYYWRYYKIQYKLNY